MSIERIGFFGDIHCGSHFGLWPLDWVAKKYQHVGMVHLYSHWQRVVRELPELDLLILMGDLIDGPQWRSKGIGLWTPKLSEQVEGAIEILRPLVKKAKVVMRVLGTEYHEDGHNPLLALDHAFNIDTTTHVAQMVNVNLGTAKDPQILNVAHHPVGGAALYQGTVMDRECKLATIAAARGQVPDPKWIVRAHLHNARKFGDGKTTFRFVPCWQLPTPWSTKVGHWKWQPDLGGLMMFRDDCLPEWARSGWRWKWLRVPSPSPKKQVMTLADLGF